MERTLSTTKWNRLFINNELLQRIKDTWLTMEIKPINKVALGVEKTITPSVNITMDNIGHFKMQYVIAQKTRKKTFVFDGEEYSVKFAKFLIDHFELK
jgi:hypothetical protein